MTQPQNQGPQGGPEPGQQQGGEGDALDELDAALGQDENPDGGGEAGEWTAPTREEWEAAQAALEAEKAKLARARKQAQRLRENGKGQPQATGGAPEDGDPAAQASGPDPQLAVWQARAVRTAAKAELLARGADPEMVDLALGRLRPDQVDFTADDEPDLDAWLDEMEDRYPKLFAKPQQSAAEHPGARRPMGSVDQGRAAAGTGTGQGAPRKRYGQQVLDNAARAQGRRR